LRGFLPFLLLPLAACDGTGTSLTVNMTSDEDGNSSIGSDNGQLAIKAPGFEGAIKLPQMNINAEDFDVNGVKLYPDSKIGALNVDAEEKQGERDKGRVRVSFESPAAVQTVQSWFSDNMTKRGFKVEAEGAGLKGTTDEGDPFRLTLEPAGDAKSKGVLEVGN
jgi:hypothetical protein